MLAKGINPVEQDREAKRAATIAAVTFGDVAELWLAKQAPGWRSTGRSGKTLHDTRQQIFRHSAKLIARPVAAITKFEVRDVLLPLWTKLPDTARRLLTTLKNVFDHAKANDMRFDNPAEWRGCQKELLPTQRKSEQRHHPSLHYSAIPDFLAKLRPLQNKATAALALEMVAYSGCRADEAAGMRWEEVGADNVWRLPPTRTKQGRPQSYPLCARLVELLERQKIYSGRSPFVFEGRRPNRPLTGRSLLSFLRGMGYDKTEVDVHGFRASFRTWMEHETGNKFSWETKETAIGHAVGNATERAYIRGEPLKSRWELLLAWATYIEGAASP
jgi:integrase